jgi:hypothetical protein
MKPRSPTICAGQTPRLPSSLFGQEAEAIGRVKMIYEDNHRRRYGSADG